MSESEDVMIENAHRLQNVAKLVIPMLVKETSRGRRKQRNKLNIIRKLTVNQHKGDMIKNARNSLSGHRRIKGAAAYIIHSLCNRTPK